MFDATAFDRHERIAFQISGGRDSMAALHVVREFWPRMHFYHLDTGDQPPETKVVIDQVRERFGLSIEVVHSNVQAYWESHGWPSDVVPVSATPVGRMVDPEPVKVVGRYDCCHANIMWPMQQRMLTDEITLIVRGQRDGDYRKAPMQSGDVSGGIEVLYPVQEWTTADVDAYVRKHDLPLAPWYATGQAHGSDCLHCTAWWDDGRLPHLKKHHPEVHAEVDRRLDLIMGAVRRQLDNLTEEDHG